SLHCIKHDMVRLILLQIQYLENPDCRSLYLKLGLVRIEGEFFFWWGKLEMGKCQILDWLFGIATKKGTATNSS
ncbi:MAG: hypothetical protein IKP77_06420, partial [Acholeplasmatales bacterium]|nr:hypothetical protein [Acholeplasmatales bacterium]